MSEQTLLLNEMEADAQLNSMSEDMANEDEVNKTRIIEHVIRIWSRLLS